MRIVGLASGRRRVGRSVENAAKWAVHERKIAIFRGKSRFFASKGDLKESKSQECNGELVQQTCRRIFKTRKNAMTMFFQRNHMYAGPMGSSVHSRSYRGARDPRLTPGSETWGGVAEIMAQ